jgi:hypothetical protein
MGGVAGQATCARAPTHCPATLCIPSFLALFIPFIGARQGGGQAPAGVPPPAARPARQGDPTIYELTACVV